MTKKERILDRDGHRCRICGTEKQLRIFPLTDIPGSLPPGAMPSVLQATLCRKHGRKLKQWRKGKKVKNPEGEFSEYEKIYHPGVFRAEQHLNNL